MAPSETVTIEMAKPDAVVALDILSRWRDEIDLVQKTATDQPVDLEAVALLSQVRDQMRRLISAFKAALAVAEG